MKVDVYNNQGEKSGTLEISDQVFGLDMNEDLLHQIYVGEHANTRNVTAHTKTKSERRGGGRKPWRQKGTGRARVGSTRSPIWRKGGVTFGPRSNRNYSKKITKKMRRKALLTLLSDKARHKDLVVVDNFDLSEPRIIGKWAN